MTLWFLSLNLSTAFHRVHLILTAKNCRSLLLWYTIFWEYRNAAILIINWYNFQFLGSFTDRLVFTSTDVWLIYTNRKTHGYIPIVVFLSSVLSIISLMGDCSTSSSYRSHLDFGSQVRPQGLPASTDAHLSQDVFAFLLDFFYSVLV